MNPSQATLYETLQRNLDTVTWQMKCACAASERSLEDVDLIAVTKYAAWEWVQALAELHPTFGESRPQQLADRRPQLPDAEWHLIGQVQRNKARLAVRHADVIHSVNSLRLLERLSRLAKEEQHPVRILLQVNISGEASKSGFDPQSLMSRWSDIIRATGSHLKVTGLMTMAPQTDSPESVRPVFAGLRQLQQKLNDLGQCDELTELSMGMSRDFEVAIEEGATLIRIGRSIFDGLSNESPG